MSRRQLGGVGCFGNILQYNRSLVVRPLLNLLIVLLSKVQRASGVRATQSI